MAIYSFLLAGFISLAVRAAPTTFVHPGVLVDPVRLGLIKSRIASATEPQATFFAKATADPLSSLSYVPAGPPPDGIVECGSYDKPDIGCTNQTNDGDAAFMNALLFNLGNGTQPAYAAKAVEILNLWSSGFKGFSNSNAPLQSGWTGVKWSRAAEILRHTPGNGWAAPDVTRFTSMLYNIHLPLIVNGSGANGNWELTMIEAMFGIAVFNDDGALFDHAADYWRQRTPAYFYIHTDGPKPVPLPRGRGDTTWYNQTVYNASVDGVCQETCRDLGHMQMGYAACVTAAETAFIQGLDLYAEQSVRLVAASEFATNLLLQQTPVPFYVCNGTGVHQALTGTFEIAFEHYNNRLGLELPNTWKQITENVRPRAEQIGIITTYETLTHGAPSSL